MQAFCSSGLLWTGLNAAVVPRWVDSPLAETGFDGSQRWCAQTSATQVQAAKVKRLEAEAATGRVDAVKLERERGLLGKMTRRLNTLTGDFQAAAVQASRCIPQCSSCIPAIIRPHCRILRSDVGPDVARTYTEVARGVDPTQGLEISVWWSKRVSSPSLLSCCGRL